MQDPEIKDTGVALVQVVSEGQRVAERSTVSGLTNVIDGLMPESRQKPVSVELVRVMKGLMSVQDDKIAKQEIRLAEKDEVIENLRKEREDLRVEVASLDSQIQSLTSQKRAYAGFLAVGPALMTLSLNMTSPMFWVLFFLGASMLVFGGLGIFAPKSWWSKGNA